MFKIKAVKSLFTKLWDGTVDITLCLVYVYTFMTKHYVDKCQSDFRLIWNRIYCGLIWGKNVIHMATPEVNSNKNLTEILWVVLEMNIHTYRQTVLSHYGFIYMSSTSLLSSFLLPSPHTPVVWLYIYKPIYYTKLYYTIL